MCGSVSVNVSLSELDSEPESASVSVSVVIRFMVKVVLIRATGILVDCHYHILS